MAENAAEGPVVVSGGAEFYAPNKTVELKEAVMVSIARLFREETLLTKADTIPLRIIKRDDKPFRCCIEKDRAVIKFRTIASLGFGLDDEETIDNSLIVDYAERAMEREKLETPILTFIDEACKACVRVNFFVTDVCVNCVAQPCQVNCPKNAISTVNQKAKIDPAKCINCGICQKVCPYSAIVYVPVPCEAACPVDAISKDENGKEYIDYDKCIFCGKCIKACPFGAVMERSQIVDVLRALSSDRPVIAMVAPSAKGQFPGTYLQFAGALKELGFSQVFEVAVGADVTARHEAEEFGEKLVSEEKPLMGTSCCPAYVEAVLKHSRSFLPFVSKAKTPMAYTALLAKETFPDSVRVFIGPCVAKKHEATNNDDVHYVLTYQELSALLKGYDIDISRSEEGSFYSEGDIAVGHGFPVSSGVAGAVKAMLETEEAKEGLKPVLIDGLTKKSIKLLELYGQGKAPGNLIEVMSCEGGCIFGPGVVNNPKKVQRQVKKNLL